MPPSPDFYQATPDSTELLGSLNEKWGKSRVFEGYNAFACKLTLLDGKTLLGLLNLDPDKLGMGGVSIPTYFCQKDLDTMKPKQKELFMNNTQVIHWEEILPSVKGKKIAAGDFIGEFEYLVSSHKDYSSLQFNREEPSGENGFREIKCPILAGGLQGLSAEGLVVVFQQSFSGWKVEPLAINE